MGARTSRIEIGTAVIDMRYENPFYMAEDAGAADLIAGGRLQLGISRGSPEQVIDGYRHFGHVPAEGEDDGAMARPAGRDLPELLSRRGFAEPNPRPMFPNPPGLLRLEPHSPGLRDRIWWGAATNATAAWAAALGHEYETSTLKFDGAGQPLHLQQAEQIEAFRTAWRGPGTRASRASRSAAASSRWSTTATAPISGTRSRGATRSATWTRRTRAVFGRTYAAEPDVLVRQLAEDTAIAAADTLLLTVPNQLGVDYNAHVIESDPAPRCPGARLALNRRVAKQPEAVPGLPNSCQIRRPPNPAVAAIRGQRDAVMR